jgi:transposase
MVYRRYPYLVKDQVHIMPRTAQISKEKQVHLYLRHECQSKRKNSRTLKVSSSVVPKTMKRFDETGSHEDCHRKGRPKVTSAAEDRFSRVHCTSDWSPNKSFTEFKKHTHLNMHCS